nr:hypothetical protein TetV2_00261 [Oceanusvirus sp.]
MLNVHKNPAVSLSAATDPSATLHGASEHFAPASEGGQQSQRHAAIVSSAYTDAYYRRRHDVNQGMEHLQYLPPGQPQDDMWSGSQTDTSFWQTNADAIIGRQRLGLTRAQRAKIDAPSPLHHRHDPLPGGARFFESTKSRSRGMSSNTVSYPLLKRGNIATYSDSRYAPTFEIETPII